MKARPILPQYVQDIVEKEAERQAKSRFLEILEEQCMEADAKYLLAARNEFGFGVKRLTRLWERMVRDTEELINRYDMEEASESGYAAIQQLKRIGFDIKKKYDEVRINGKKLKKPRL